MNIAFLVVKHIIRGGGIERYTLELGSRLVDRGHNVTVYSMRHYGQVPTEYKGMRIISVPSFAAYSMQKLSCSAVAAVRASFNQEFDILHFHSLAPA
ncbi:MAG: glycosyltransferase family 4 protein, partial [Dehalococcoidia bacterium]|nr:glycosyltransferase family 4 protein [Dehalococcoidia bacterium]